MATPYVEWYEVTDDDGSPSMYPIGTVDFGAVDFEHWTKAKAIKANIWNVTAYDAYIEMEQNIITTKTVHAKQTWKDTDPSGNITYVDTIGTHAFSVYPSGNIIYNSLGWKFGVNVETEWIDPSNITDNMKEGIVPDPSGNSWTDFSSAKDVQINNSGETDYIYLALYIGLRRTDYVDDTNLPPEPSCPLPESEGDWSPSGDALYPSPSEPPYWEYDFSIGQQVNPCSYKLSFLYY